MKYINMKGIKKTKTGVQKARSRRILGIGTGWCATLVLFTLALVLVIGCSDTPGAQVELYSANHIEHGTISSNLIDTDDDGLIDIHSLEQLNNVRYNLAGTSYKTSSSDNGVMCGVAKDTKCTGYELTRNLDFANADSYDSNTINATWRPTGGDPAAATNDGWEPIDNFATVFEGNEHTISNIYSRRSDYVGLFGRSSGPDTAIRNIGILDSSFYGNSDNKDYVGALVGQNNSTIDASYATRTTVNGSGNNDEDDDDVGGLVGRNNGGAITNSYATYATVDGGNGNNDRVGGLVGENSGTISTSYATNITARGGAGEDDRVGGLVGYNEDGTINASYATNSTANGGADKKDRVGGLVGHNTSSTIIASYATSDSAGSDVDGGGGEDYVGGLVGYNINSTIIASYATVNADGGDGIKDDVGGLVGHNDGSRAIIIASYATGDAAGGRDDSDRVGGLVGRNSGTISASYATGTADGSAGNHDGVGGLVGHNSGTIRASYAIGDADGGDGGGYLNFVGALVGQNISGTITASYGFGMLENATTTVAATATTATAGVHDSGDRPNGVLGVDSGPTGAKSLTAANTPTAWNSTTSNSMNAWDFGTATDIPILRYADYDGSGGTAYGCGTTTGSTATIPATVPDGSGGTLAVICDSTVLPGQDRTAVPMGPTDADGDTLIDISSLEQLDNVRYNLAGTSYKTSSTDSGMLCGTDGTAACTGYELTQNLDFATASSYDDNSINSAWRPNNLDPDDATNSGWEPIGNAANAFATVFEGNGHTISNLYSRRGGHVGLFGYINSRATIRNIGIIDNALYGSSGNSDHVGGLMGENNGTITASYATGDADGGSGNFDYVGGLVGRNSGTITASYATGDADGSSSDNNDVGGLVGRNSGTITASYATGDADGGSGNFDDVGGLVGRSSGTITASYATGDADGGGGNGDYVGGLVGWKSDGTITASYGFGTLTNVDTAGVDDSGDRPNGVAGVGSGPNGARFLSATNTPAASWNNASNNSANAWTFGATTDIPTLRYADYDGTGTTYSCAAIPATVPDGSGGTTTVTCDTTPLPGQNPAVTPLLNPFDADGDGLIDIHSLVQLHNMRYNLAGTSYKTSSTDSGVMCGINFDTACSGYELRKNLTFDRDGDGRTYNTATYVLDSGDHHAAYFPVTNGTGGWQPIGDATNPFSTIFEGNGFSISGLAVRRTNTYIGMFGRTDSSAIIRNIRLANNLADYAGNIGSRHVGGLVAYNEGTISASHAGGLVDGGSGSFDRIGGLVGENRGTIIASYATGDADGGDGRTDYVGGLVGDNSGTITASNATGDADGDGGNDDRVGGLVGWNSGTITASNATGDADGDGGNDDRVGGLVGWNSGTITASNATGDADGDGGRFDLVGGLVGWNSGTITASNATGDADGGDGDGDRVGGLVGSIFNGTITASYATGDADGSIGDSDSVGGLVGSIFNGTITASYATGDADGGNGIGDDVGGLVGSIFNGTITASYATGDADGGNGIADDVGGLVGININSTITASYGFGTLTNVGTAGVDDSGDRPSGVAGVGSGFNGARFLSAANTPTAWNSATSDSLSAWTFGTTTDIPTLRYADYDGTGTNYGCGSTTGSTATIPATVPDGSGGTTTVTCGTTSLPGQTPTVNPVVNPFDTDNDKLIDIRSLEQLHNMRYNLAGTSYKTSSADSGVMCGAALDTACSGYELMHKLTFDRDGGGTYNRTTYALDSGDHHATYFPVTTDGTGGWLPIGDATNPFSTTFEGNGFYIRGLAVRRNQTYVGMFGYIDSSAIIRNIRLTNSLADYTGSSNKSIYVGGLVAYNTGAIIASHAGGDVDGGDGNLDYVGGLVGNNISGTITASYATGDADGGNGEYDSVGGLAGSNSSGTITASYATGDADGGNGIFDSVGGLVGGTNGTITASYATGDADDSGNYGNVGGLAGKNNGGIITASYATGDADGGVGDDDRVGGLVGSNNHRGTITASYATGNADGGTGTNDSVGSLVGSAFNRGTNTASYGFGSSVNGEKVGIHGSGGRPSGVLDVGSGPNGARLLTSANTPTAWNSASMNAWDFGTATDIPTLRYVDYDGVGTTYGCGSTSTADIVIPDRVPAPGVSGGVISVTCGTTSLSGQTPAVDSALLINPIDTDADGLIDIRSLEQLHNMRYNLAGTSYKTSSTDRGIMCGAALNTACSGYELRDNLTFDRDGGGTYNRTTYALDSGDHHATYFPVTGGTGGWKPIGDATNPFSTVFEGNAFYIRGLAVRRNQTYIGMFGRTDSNAIIRNIRLTNNLADYTGNSDRSIYIGGLVAYNEGTISASHAGGDADGGDGNLDYVGGLVGSNVRGTITASYGTGDADGGNGEYDSVGGLAGSNTSGTITASYATGDADGGDGFFDGVGGLVGSTNGTITASYATGNADGGNGEYDSVGGLAGSNTSGTITASYATGNADGGSGNYDRVSGLVGSNHHRGTITASYATGNADGGDGIGDRVGGLVGYSINGIITASYGFGTSMNGEVAGMDDSSDLDPDKLGVGIAGARRLRPAGYSTYRSVTAGWNQANSNTKNAWNFGTDSQAPALRYADYDGSGTKYGCGSTSTATIVIPNRVPVSGGFINVTCASTLLGGPQPR